MVDPNSVKCVVCGKDYRTRGKRHQARYCSSVCAGKARYGVYKNNGISNGSRGAISELRASTDLLEKGFEVFRALSPASSCDLAILKGGRVIRVEVRTGYRDLKSGKIVTQRKHRADVLAIVLPDEIVYEPDLQDNETQAINHEMAEFQRVQ